MTSIQDSGGTANGGVDTATPAITSTVTVVPTNDQPTATNLITTSAYAEDALSVAITDIVVTDPDNGETITATLTLNDPLNAGVLTANNGASYNTGTGVWTITDTVANVNTALANVAFQPASDYDVDTTITVNIVDGGEDGTVAVTGTITLDVTPAPDAPTSADGTTNTVQNFPYIFAPGDFNFADVDTGDSLSQVRIVTLPAGSEGVLSLNGLPVAANDAISLANIAGGNLIFTPFTDYMGTATFTFRVIDTTALDSVLAYTMTVNVVNANAPVITAGSTLNYTENDPASVIDNTIFVGDNSNELTAGLVSISAGYNPGEDQLLFSDTAEITGVWNGATGELTLTSVSGTATLAQYQAALRSITYVNLSDNPTAGNRTISFAITDNDLAGIGGPYTSIPATSTVVVTPVNDAPVLTGGNILNYQEDDPATAIDLSFAIVDVDSSNIFGATITIESGYINGQDILGFTDTANITGSWNAATGIMTLTGTDSIVAYRNALRSITYQNIETANPFAGDRIISFLVNDGWDNSNMATSTVSVATVDDPPTLTAGATINYTEDDPATIVDTTITIADVDSALLQGAIVRITGGYIVAEDELGFTDTANITASWDGNGTLTLSGTDTIAAYQAALRSVTYINNNHSNPNSGNRTISFQVADDTGPSVGATSTVTMSSVNDAPVITAGSTLNYTEGDAATVVDSSLLITDVDSTTMTGATITINGYVSGEDVLAFTDQNGITGSWDGVNGIMTLSGNATLAYYQTALRSITYHNSDAVTPTAGNRTVEFTVSDGTDTSQTATSTVIVTAVDSPPSATNMNTAESFSEDAPAFALTTIVITDIDSPAVTAVLTLSDPEVGALSANNGATYDSGTGVWTITDTVANVNTALANVQFTPAGDYNQDFTIATLIKDDTTTITGSKQVTVTPVNDAPILDTTFSPALSVIQLNETANSGNTVGSIVSDGSITDIDQTADEAMAIIAVDNSHGAWQYSTDGGQNWKDVDDGSLGAAHALLLDGSDSSQRIRFVPDNDFYGTATFTFRAWDKTSGSAGTYADAGTSGGTTPFSADSDNATITVNDIPRISGVTNQTFTENDAPLIIAPALVLTDRDSATLQSATVRLGSGYVAGQDRLYYTTTGGISASWDAASGTLTFSGSASVAAYQATLRSIIFETPGDDPVGGGRAVSIMVNDGTTASQAATSTISVVVVNDPPELTGGTDQDYVNSQRQVVIDDTITLGDPDNTSMTGAQIRITQGYVEGKDFLRLVPPAGITYSWDPATATLTLSGTATKAVYQQALRNITFTNTEGFSVGGARTVSFTVSDGSLDSRPLVSTINVLANQAVPSDQALTPISFSPDLTPPLRPEETSGAAFTRLIEEPPFTQTESTIEALDGLNLQETVSAAATGNNRQMAREYGYGPDDAILRYNAGLDPNSINEKNEEIDRILTQLSEENLPIPPELLLIEAEPAEWRQPDEKPVPERRVGERESGRDLNKLSMPEKAGEAKETPALKEKAVPPIKTAPGLAEQISKAAGSFEQGRQQLLGPDKDKAGAQPPPIPPEIAETFADVYELLQCE